MAPAKKPKKNIKKKEKRFETSFVWWSNIQHKRTGKTSYLLILAFTLPEMTNGFDTLSDAETWWAEMKVTKENICFIYM